MLVPLEGAVVNVSVFPVAVYAVLFALAWVLILFSNEDVSVVTNAIGVLSTGLARVKDVVVPSPVNLWASFASASSWFNEVSTLYRELSLKSK